MTINFSQLKSIPYRAKLLIGVAAGVLLFSILFLSFRNQYFADTLAGYVPGATVFYAHFSLPQTKNAQPLEQILAKTLSDRGWPIAVIDQVKREAAVVAYEEQGSLHWLIFLRLYQSQQAEKLFKANNINYLFLDGSRVVLAGNASELKAISRNKKSSFLKSFKIKNPFFSSLQVRIKPEFFVHFAGDRSVAVLKQYLANSSGQLVLFFRIKSQCMAVISPVLANQKRSPKIKAEAIDPDFSVVFCTDDYRQLTSFLAQSADEGSGYWHNYLNLLKQNSLLEENLVSRILPRGFFLAFSPKINATTSGWFFQDNDFVFSSRLSQPLDEASLSGWKKIWQYAWATRFPSFENTVLSDGTILTEFRADPTDFTFQDIGGNLALKTDFSSSTVWYRHNDNQLTAASKKFWLNFQPADCHRYLKIKTDLLPDAGLFSYLKFFKVLEFNGNSFYLK